MRAAVLCVDRRRFTHEDLEGLLPACCSIIGTTQDSYDVSVPRTRVREVDALLKTAVRA